MANKGKYQQQSGESDFEQSAIGTMEQPPRSRTSYQSESSEEVVSEVKGTTDQREEAMAYQSTGNQAEAETVIEAGTEQDAENHKPMSSPTTSRGAEGGDGEASENMLSYEAADTESEFENVEGWDESQLTEAAGEEAEPTLEASFADLETLGPQDGKEFFGAIAGLIAPMIPTLIKAVAPTVIKTGGQIVSGLVTQGSKKLSSNTQNVINRLKQLGINVPPNILSRLETGDEADEEASMETDGVAMEALAQQLEALEVVIGRDDRVQIKNTTVVPWKRICHLKITAGNGKSYLGTGFFIGPRTIATAGHCVYIHGQGGWVRKIVVTPGRNGSQTPFNSFTATKFRSVRGWVLNKLRNYDYGVIQLDRNASVSPNIGSFGFGYYQDQFLLSKRLNTAGYPGDKPPGTMWFNGRKAKSVTDRTIIYDIDTMGGQSGSPVWFKDSSGKRIVVGIHTNGATSGNSATRIVKPVFDNLKAWRAEATSGILV